MESDMRQIHLEALKFAILTVLLGLNTYLTQLNQAQLRVIEQVEVQTK